MSRSVNSGKKTGKNGIFLGFFSFVFVVAFVFVFCDAKDYLYFLQKNICIECCGYDNTVAGQFVLVFVVAFVFVFNAKNIVFGAKSI